LRDAGHVVILNSGRVAVAASAAELRDKPVDPHLRLGVFRGAKYCGRQTTG
jgi:hypothetical protein